MKNLSNEQFEKATDWLNSKARRPCPLCGNTELEVMPSLGYINFSEPNDSVNRSAPVVIGFCGHCVLLRPYSAKHMGIEF